MVKHVLPEGVRGAVVAGLLGGADELARRRVQRLVDAVHDRPLQEVSIPIASEQQLVWVGRMATVAMTVIALVWIPVIRNAPRGLYDYLQGVQGYLAPPIFVVFFLGVFWKRLNAAGCLAALMVGFLMGLFRLAVDTPITLGLKGFEERLHRRLVPLDRQQHLLPVLQPADLPRFVAGDDRRQLPDAARPSRPRSRASPTAR